MLSTPPTGAKKEEEQVFLKNKKRKIYGEV
jgi:hypothetical protein